jgi:DNA transformation protein
MKAHTRPSKPASPPRLNPQAAFADYACELLASVGPVSKRAMFGGYGLYADGMMFALIAFERLYLKVDAHNKPQFLASGCEPFVYDGKGKPVTMSYYEPPADAMESPELMRLWARLAFDAALRAASAKAYVKDKPKSPRKPSK